MYLNIGHKLKVISKVAFWVLLAAFEIAGVVLVIRMLNGSMSVNFFSMLSTTAGMLLAPAIAWLFSIPLYVLGHMMENSEIRTDLAVRSAAAQGLINTDFLQMDQEQVAPKTYATTYEAPPQTSGAAYHAPTSSGYHPPRSAEPETPVQSGPYQARDTSGSQYY